MTQRYDVLSPRPGKDGKTFYTKVGVAWPMKAREGFSVTFEALPLPTMEDGALRTVVLIVPAEEKQADAAPMPSKRQGKENWNKPAPVSQLDDEIPF